MNTHHESVLEKKFQDIEAEMPSPTLHTKALPAGEHLAPISFSELEAIVKKWLLIEDPGLIKILIACVLCHRMRVEPVWLLIVAGPGGSKTELLRALYDLQNVYPLSDLTPQTFMSGFKDTNGSLLHRLPPEVIIIMKDFTTVLEMSAEKRSAILAQLREIYDGEYGKEFGNAESRVWHGKIGLIAGVTSIIDRHQTVFQVLGERFVKYCPIPADSIEVTKRAMANSGNERQMRDEIKSAFTNYIEGVEIPDTPEPVPPQIKSAIMHLAIFCAKARSGIIRDSYGSREITFIPEPEHATRLVKQLVNLMCALALISGEYSDDDYEIIHKIGMDTLPDVRRRIINYLFAHEGQQSLADIADAIGYLANTTRRQLEEMVCLKIVQADSASLAHSYELSSSARDLLNNSQLPPSLPDFTDDSPTVPEKSDGVSL